MDSSIDMNMDGPAVSSSSYPSTSMGGPASSTNYFQYLSFGETFSRTFHLFFDHLDSFLALSVVVMIPFGILMITYGLFIISMIVHEVEAEEEAEANGDWYFSGFQPHHIPLMGSIFVVQLTLYSIITYIGRGAMCHVVATIYLGNVPHWKTSLWEAWNRKGPLIGSSLIISSSLIVGGIMPYLFFIIAIMSGDFFWWLITILLCGAYGVGATYFYTGTILVTPTLMIEPLTAAIGGKSISMEGLHRSWDLALGSRCYIFCCLFGMYVLNNLIGRLLHNMFTNGEMADAFFTAVGLIVMIAPMIIFLPLHAILETVIYLNLRIGRESLNHQVLSTDLSADRNTGGTTTTTMMTGGGDYNIPPSSGGILVDGNISSNYRQVPLMEDEFHMGGTTTGGSDGNHQPPPPSSSMGGSGGGGNV